VVGISGATWSVIDPLLGAGRLPQLAALCARGLSAVALSDRVPGDSFRPQVAWATLATGCRAPRHGVTHFYDEADALQEPTLWEHFQRAGRSVGVYGWPATWPPRPTDGFVVPSHLARDARTWPPELSPIRTIEQRGRTSERDHTALRLLRDAGSTLELRQFGLRPRTVAALAAPAVRMIMGDPERAALSLRRARLAVAADLFVGLCQQFEPRFRAFVSFLVDFAEHRYRRYREPELFPDDATDAPRMLRNAVDDAYVRIDRVLGRLVAEAGSGAAVLVVSEHGMTPEQAPAERGRWRYLMRAPEVARFALADASIVPTPVARWLAFRQPDGGDPQRLAELAVSLREMRFAEAGPVFQVWRHAGEVVARLDLSSLDPQSLDALETVDVLHGAARIPFGALSRRVGRVRSARHDQRGIAVLAGPGVPREPLRRTIQLVDLAPTLLVLGGVPVPSGLDGRSLL
jgi:hypothetical protein